MIFGLVALLAAAASPCAPVPGADELWRPATRWVIVGEMHGTAETPAAFANLVCLASATGRPVTVGIEYSADWQPAIDAYLASDGGPSARAALVSLPIFQNEFQDGRASVAFLNMLDELRRMKQAGQIVAVKAFDIGASTPQDQTRDAAMALAWGTIPLANNGILLALVGNIHAMRRARVRPGGTIITAASLLPPGRTVTLNVVGNGGKAWNCQQEGCGEYASGRPRDAATEILFSDDRDTPWSATYELGEPTTASKPSAAEPDSEARAYLDRAITLLREKHINSAGADWDALRAQATAQIDDAQSTSDTYPAIEAILLALRERHSVLAPPRADRDPASAPSAPVESVVRTPQWRLVDHRFGLIHLPALDTLWGRQQAGDAYRTTLVAGLQELDAHDLCGWIIDLRDNVGGNMWPMLQGLDPLLGPEPFGFFVSRDGQNVPWRRSATGVFPLAGDAPRTAPAFALKNAGLPLALLIGPYTMSSGEMTALALIGRSGVKTFGMPTAGLTTANVPYKLSDGAYLVISETTVRDRTGKDYLGAIEPDEQVPLDQAQAAAMTWLDASCPASKPALPAE